MWQPADGYMTRRSSCFKTVYIRFMSPSKTCVKWPVRADPSELIKLLSLTKQWSGKRDREVPLTLVFGIKRYSRHVSPAASKPLFAVEKEKKWAIVSRSFWCVPFMNLKYLFFCDVSGGKSDVLFWTFLSCSLERKLLWNFVSRISFDFFKFSLSIGQWVIRG